MKRVKLLLALIPLISLTSCLEILEDITVKENGSGEYVMKVDAGEVMNMAMSMGGSDDNEMAAKMKEVKDTTFPLLSTLKEGQTLTPEEKELFKDSKVHLKMDLENSVFLVEVLHQFSSVENFNKMRAAMTELNKKTDNPISKLMGGDKEEDKEDPMGGLTGISGDGFNMKITGNTITRTINEEKLAELNNLPGMEQLDEQSKQMFEGVKFTTVFHLHKAVGTIDSKVMKVSDDKKTVTFENNMLELFENPKAFAFTLNY